MWEQDRSGYAVCVRMSRLVAKGILKSPDAIEESCQKCSACTLRRWTVASSDEAWLVGTGCDVCRVSGITAGTVWTELVKN